MMESDALEASKCHFGAYKTQIIDNQVIGKYADFKFGKKITKKKNI